MGRLHDVYFIINHIDHLPFLCYSNDRPIESNFIEEYAYPGIPDDDMVWAFFELGWKGDF